MAPRVPIEDRRHIARLFVQGVPERDCPKNWEGTLADAKRSGRPRVTTHDIVAAAVVDPFSSAKEIRDELSLSISTATVRRRLKEAGISNFAAAQKPFLPERQRQPRLDFALITSVGMKENVVFSDESTFCTRWDQQRRVGGP
ncbi:hypothetical protein HPB49_026118 [Dermacentor silvarum]|nr:hypothetical protein HPB49_026118 [Dermacentor silvarum]